MRAKRSSENPLRSRRARMNPLPPAPSMSRLRRHRMTLGDWNDLWVLQEGNCYLCRSPLPGNIRKVHVDHDHRCCGSVRSCQLCLRGLACDRCNWIIGLAEEDAELLKRIALYLETSYQDVSWKLWPGTPWRELCVDRLRANTPAPKLIVSPHQSVMQKANIFSMLRLFLASIERARLGD